MTTTEIVPVAVVKQVLSVQQAANSIEVTTPDQAVEASSLLHDIKEATRVLVETKTNITRPAMESLSKIKALFAPRELMLKDADKMVRSKLLAYQIEAQDKIDTAKAKIAARAEKGSIRQDTAVKKLGEVGEVEKTAGVKFTTRRKLVVVDESLVPREYLVVDREKATKALFADIVVAGCELKEEKILNVV